MCNWFWKLGLMGALSVVLQAPVLTVSKQANAQVTPDSTLAGESSVIVPNVIIRDLPSELVDGGAIRGANLFHSFQEFNVGEGRRVYFSNPSAVENIFSRVTGANSSNILGRLGVLGNANLYLMNPNGIVFGQNASLDVEGSFVATTANAIKFGNTGLFSASEPASSNLLSINPSALFYNVLNNAEIVNRSVNGLNVNEGQSLLLVGGKVKLENGVIKAPGGRVELGGLNSPGDIAISQNGNNLGLSFPNNADKADVSLTNASQVNVLSNGNTGNIKIDAKSLSMRDGARVNAGVIGNGNGGKVNINVQEDIILDNANNNGLPTSILANVEAGARGNAGDINITTGNLSVTNGALIESRVRGTGNGGQITINAKDKISFDGSRGIYNSGIYNTVEAGAVGNGGKGKVDITTGSLSMKNGARIDVGTSGNGDGGKVDINAQEDIVLDNANNNGLPTSILANVEVGARGNAGDVNITTGNLSATNGALIESRTRGTGDAGNVVIDARERVSFDGVVVFSFPNGAFLSFPSGALSNVEQTGVGKGGNIQITTGSLSLTDGAQLIASTNGKGNAGSVIINARDAVTFDDGIVVSNVQAGANGNGGDININARSLSLTNGGLINAFVRAASDGKPAGVGKAGNTIIKVNDEFKIDGSNGKVSGIFNNLGSGTTGSAGKIDITTGSLTMIGNTALSTSTFGKGNAGSVIINARDAVTFDDGDVFSNVQAGANGNGGDININARSLSLTNGGQINAFVRAASDGKPAGVGDAGDVIIKVNDEFKIDGSSGKFTGIFNDLRSGTTGSAGKIDITTGSLTMIGNTELSTSTFGKGNAGSVIINARDTVTFDDGEVFSTVEAGANGNGGDININARSLSLTNGSQINAFVREANDSKPAGVGDAGDVIIKVNDEFKIDGSSGKLSGIFNNLGSGTTGSAGKIDITTGSLTMIGNTALSTSTFGKGNAGGVTINAREAINIDFGDIFSRVGEGAEGAGGEIKITAPKVSLVNDARVSTSTFGKGNAGSVIINARDAVTFDDGDVFSTVGAGANGNGGDININARSLSLTNGGQINAFVGQADDGKLGGVGDAGDVIIKVNDEFKIDGSSGKFTGIFNDLGSGATGNAGNINITTGSLTMIGNTALSTSTFGKGNAGSVIINARDTVTFDDGIVVSNVQAGANGNGGDININARSLSLTNGGQINAFVREADDSKPAGVGDAGDVIIKVNDEFKIDGSSGKFTGIFNNLDSGTTGSAGKIDITTGSLTMIGNTELSTSTFGKGNAGSVIINARDAVTFDGGEVFSNVGAGANGNGGDININARSLSLTNGGQVNAFVGQADDGKPAGVGDAGDVIIKVNDEFKIDGSSGKFTGIFNDLRSGATGNAGNIDITTGSLTMIGNTELSTSTFGKGNAGSVIINARDTVTFDDGEVFSTVEAGANGNGGDININARSLSLTNGGEIDAFVGQASDGKPGGVGDAGDVIIKVNDEFKIDGSSGKFTGIVNNLGSGATGNAGNIDITTGSLSMMGNALVISNTFGQGNAGSITINARDAVSMMGNAGLSTGNYGNGNAGNINMGAKQISLSSNAYIESQSVSASKAGNITITSSGTLSANDSIITTSAFESSGGAISIQAANIRLFGDSDITTNVGSGAGDGGDITLTANSIIALGDSDILAFARDGQGGDVSLNTPAFFGQNYKAAPRGTEPSTLDGNNRVDINASGAVSGVISLPDTSFIQNSLSELPENLIDTGNLIANSCIARANSQQQGTFIITGSGALPSRPGDALMSQYTFGSVRTNNVSASSRRPWQKGDPIIEPQGAYRLPSGRLVLSRECS